MTRLYLNDQPQSPRSIAPGSAYPSQGKSPTFGRTIRSSIPYAIHARFCFGSEGRSNSTTGLPRKVQQPKTDWFDPDKPAKAEPATDWSIEIYNGRFVGARYNIEGPPTIFGDIRANAEFVAWVPSDRSAGLARTTIAKLAQEILAPRFVDFIAEWDDPTKFSEQHKALGYKTESHHVGNDSLRLFAEATARAPLFKTSVNVTFAIRRALRRYLRIEPPEPSLSL